MSVLPGLVYVLFSTPKSLPICKSIVCPVCLFWSYADVAQLTEFADWSLSGAAQYMTHHLGPVPQKTKVTPLADEDDQDEQGGDDHNIR